MFVLFCFFLKQLFVSQLKYFLFKDLGQDEWELLKIRNPIWNEVDLRDNRYDQIIHLVFYFLKYIFNKIRKRIINI
jgi:hypothetical protein